MIEQSTELAALEQIKSGLEADGYSVIIMPRALDIPTFLERLVPDAIATRDDNHILIEVVSRSSTSKDKIARFRDAIAGHANWTFLPIWTSGQTVPSVLAAPDKDQIKNTFVEIDALVSASFLRPAFVMQWSLLEAIGRKLIPGVLARYQTPKTLIEKLAGMGHLSNSDSSLLRGYISLRNQIVHGKLDTAISVEVIENVNRILRRLDRLHFNT